MNDAMESCGLLTLPTETIIHIFRYLNPDELLAVERTSPELARLARIAYAMHTVRFLPHYSSNFFREYIDKHRADVISQLDISGCSSASSRTLEACIELCARLTTLRCINTRLLPTTLIRLLRTRLHSLKSLEWSLLGNKHVGEDVRRFLQEPVVGDAHTILPDTLRSMYVEEISCGRNTRLLCVMLKRGSCLRELHFHERLRRKRNTTAAHDVLLSYHTGTCGKFTTFTYTNDSAVLVREANLRAPWNRQHADSQVSSVFGMFDACRTVSSSVIVRLNPSLAGNCLILDGVKPLRLSELFSQISVMVRGDPLATLKSATCHRPYCHIHALILESPSLSGQVRSRHQHPANADPLLAFIRGFPFLAELNLASFHCESNVDCCSILADAGLDNLKALALPSCAFCWKGRLEPLARARFRLDELDVRAPPVKQFTICAVCAVAVTCTAEILQPLWKLCPLLRLTLCNLSHVRSLVFLKRCVVRELRLQNLHSNAYEVEESRTAMKEVMLEVRSLKFGSTTETLDLSFLDTRAVPAPNLRRLCVTLKEMPFSNAQDLLDRLCIKYPTAEYIHLHICHPEGHQGAITLTARYSVELDGDKDGALHLEPVLSSDDMVLCGCANVVAVTRPRNCGPRRF
ncbi:uncharacterized protein [Dermacentor albipictus]|uniref:uncharacterized protein n=1 Tax=Dermacentor albipictus TaxID=60249 RepID=UPI0031FC51BF